ncbi:hypothetical protein SAY86_007642 [Trapa natans]|uniref:Bifunctional inhibitor/plant lipid transfer protein/seed storage helical domain-containing protein n=1 Tax=Trapa natans TaxID=22666 RepID=A0AAN7L8P2_TRANT|nr:hypothetical protein SAY86_007642 [Trapa natans]
MKFELINCPEDTLICMTTSETILLLYMILGTHSTICNLKSWFTMNPGNAASAPAPFTAVLFMAVAVLMMELAGGAACSSTFFAALVQLVPCRAAVAPFSPIPPNEACCNAIRALGQPCLCLLVNGPPISGMDRNLTLQLPAKCTVNFEPCKTVLHCTHTTNLHTKSGSGQTGSISHPYP